MSASKSTEFAIPSPSESKLGLLTGFPFEITKPVAVTLKTPVPAIPFPSGSKPPDSIESGIVSLSESKSKWFGIPSPSVSKARHPPINWCWENKPEAVFFTTILLINLLYVYVKELARLSSVPGIDEE